MDAAALPLRVRVTGAGKPVVAADSTAASIVRRAPRERGGIERGGDERLARHVRERPRVDDFQGRLMHTAHLQRPLERALSRG